MRINSKEDIIKAKMDYLQNQNKQQPPVIESLKIEEIEEKNVKIANNDYLGKDTADRLSAGISRFKGHSTKHSEDNIIDFTTNQN